MAQQVIYQAEDDIPAARAGDRNAKERIVSSMMDAIYKFAHSYSKLFKNILFDDLVQEGCLTVLRCIDQWRAEDEIKFSTYCYSAIRNQAYTVCNRTRIMFQSASQERTWEDNGDNDPRGVEGVAIEDERDLPLIERFPDLTSDQCRVLYARLEPMIHGRGPRRWSMVAKMESIPVKECMRLYASGIDAIRDANGESL